MVQARDALVVKRLILSGSVSLALGLERLLSASLTHGMQNRNARLLFAVLFCGLGTILLGLAYLKHRASRKR